MVFETFSKYAVLLYVFNGFSSDFLTEASSGQGAVAQGIFLGNPSEVLFQEIVQKRFSTEFKSGIVH